MDTNISKSEKNKGIDSRLKTAEKFSTDEKELEKNRRILEERVLDMLRDPDPVRGIYAMYGTHDRHLRCSRKK